MTRQEQRARRRRRVRKKIFGVPDRPRVSVFRSNRHIYAQIIDDLNGITLAAASSLDGEVQEEGLSGSEMARRVGGILAERAAREGVQKVVFDRGGYKYHGQVKALAEGAREKGLEF